MNEIFISYSRTDKAFAQKLAEAFAGSGRDPWVDWEDIPLTADWWAEIQRGIEGAHTFVFVISPDSVSSTVCAQEIEHATAHNKRIIPVVHRDAKEVPGTLTHLNWVFFRETEDFETAFQGLLKSIDTDLDWVKAHTRLTVRAVEWENHERNDSYVLRGDDLKQAEQRLAETDKEPKLTGLQVQYVAASQQSAIRRQRKVLMSVAFGLLAATILGCIAFLNFQASRREANLRVQAEAEAEEAAAARATSVVIQQTAESEAEVAVNRAREAQVSALAAETAEAQALVAEATAEAARQNAETDREGAVSAQETALAARAVAQTQQAQAEVGLQGAVVAQQTAEASQGQAVAAQQTAMAGEAQAEFSQATAVAGQSTAQAQQATAIAGQATAQAQQEAAQAAAQQAAQAQAEAEAALEEAQSSLEAAEEAQAEAEAAKAQAEAEKALAEAAKATVEAEKALAETAKAQAEIAQAQAETDKATAQAELVAVNNLRATVEAELAQAQNLINEARQASFIAKYSETCEETFQASEVIQLTSDGEHIWVLLNQDPFIFDEELLVKIRASNCEKVAEYPFELSFISNTNVADITYGDGYIWAVDERSGSYYQFDLDLTSFYFLSFEAGINPNAVMYSRGSLWVASGNTINRVHPDAGFTLMTYPTNGRSIELVDDGVYIWAITENSNLIRINPATGEILTVTLPYNLQPLALTYNGRYIWVGLNNNYVAKIEAESGALIDVFSLGNKPTGLAFGGGSLWVYDASKNEVVKGQPDTNSELSAIPLDAGFVPVRGSMLFDGLHLWVFAQAPGALQISYNTGVLMKVPVSSYMVGSSPGVMVEDGDYLWVANIVSSSISKVRADTGVQILSTRISYPLDMVLAGDYLWVLNPGLEGDLLSKVNRADGKTVATVALARPSPFDLAYDGTYLWVGYENVLLRYRESDGAFVDQISTFGTGHLLYAGTNMWLTNPLQKLRADGSREAIYGLNLFNPLYDGRYLWGTIDKIDNGNFITYKAIQIDPTDGSEVNRTGFLASSLSPGAAYDGENVWINGQKIPVTDLNYQPYSAALCAKASYPLYHSRTRTLWVSCPDDNGIQKIYIKPDPAQPLSALSPRMPEPASAPIYLPLITKGRPSVPDKGAPPASPAPTAMPVK